MTKNRWLEDPDALAEAERIYAFIGKYVIAFQWLEGKIDEIFLLARGHENRAGTFVWLASKTNSAKVDAFQRLVIDSADFKKVEIDRWYERFDSTVDRLHIERRRRNSLVHAQYLLDFLAIGAPVMRTHVQRRDGETHFDQDHLTPRRCQTILMEVAQLSFDLNMICVQLYQSFLHETDDK